MTFFAETRLRGIIAAEVTWVHYRNEFGRHMKLEKLDKTANRQVSLQFKIKMQDVQPGYVRRGVASFIFVNTIKD